MSASAARPLFDATCQAHRSWPSSKLVWDGVWWTRGDSNPRPPRCERGGKIHKAWCCDHLRLLKVALNGQLGQPGKSWFRLPKGKGTHAAKGPSLSDENTLCTTYHPKGIVY